MLFAFCSWNWNKWSHDGLCSLKCILIAKLVKCINALESVHMLFVIKQASNSFPPIHTTDNFDCFFILLVFVINSWLLDCCFSVFIKYLLSNSLVCYLHRIYTFSEQPGPKTNLCL